MQSQKLTRNPGFLEIFRALLPMRLLTLSRRSKQAWLIAADVVAYVVTAAFSLWEVAGSVADPSPS
jgi:hypothetical protein